MPFPLPAFIQFYPTLRCNQRCSFCFNRGMPEQQDMAFDDAMRMLDLLCRSRVGTLDIMGGEPLLLDWIADFARQAAGRGLSVNISTNGSLPGMISAFRGIPADRLRIGVSIEGDEAAHCTLTGAGNFERAFETLARIREAGLLPMAKTVVSERTLLSMRRLVPLLQKAGVREYYLIHADVMERGQAATGRSLPFQDFLRFFGQVASEFPALGIGKVHASCFRKQDLPSGVRCAGGVKKLAVMPDGSVYPCNLLAHFVEFRLGNISGEPVEALWQHPVLSRFRAFSGNSCDLRDCTNYGACTGGCPAHNLLHRGGFDGRDIRCHAHAPAE
ncbi:MAG: SPASM domain-containing protein [Thermodesulfovibrionales bacterium]